MSTTTYAPTVPAAARATNWLLFTLLLVGTVLTVTLLADAIGNGTLSVLTPTHYLGAALLFWSPLPFSIPAVLLEGHRDAALPQMRGLVGWPVRAVALLPYLLFSPRSQVRVEVAASLVGFLGACAAAAPHLTWPL